MAFGILITALGLVTMVILAPIMTMEMDISHGITAVLVGGLLFLSGIVLLSIAPW